MDQKEFRKAYSKLVAKAWSDDDFKARLLANPSEVLKENKISVPEHIEVKFVETTENTVHLILPPKPSDELTAHMIYGSHIYSTSDCTNDLH
jgi:hypothetical protein